MNTKEAIKILDSVPIPYRADKVIDLLKRGEKYEKMWEELEEYPLEYSYAAMQSVIDDLKQKYFPK